MRRISAAFFLSISASCLSLRANSNSRCTSLLISSTSCFITWARRRISRDWCNVDGTLSLFSIPVHRVGGGCSSSDGAGLSEWALLSPLFFFITLAYCVQWRSKEGTCILYNMSHVHVYTPIGHGLVMYIQKPSRYHGNSTYTHV